MKILHQRNIDVLPKSFNSEKHLRLITGQIWRERGFEKLYQWFLDLRMHQYHLERWSNFQFLDSTLKDLVLLGLG